MFSLLFRNRWIAFGWVALVLASAAAFVGKGGGVGKIAQSTRQLAEQRKVFANPPPPVPTVRVVRMPAAAATAQPDPQRLRAIPGMPGDPANPEAGDVFLDSVTGQRVRAVRRSDAVPASDAAAYSSSAASP